MNARLLRFLLPALGLALAAGCASPTNTGAMIPSVAQASKKFPAPLQLVVSGGGMSAAWNSQITDADFRSALQSALVTSGLFQTVADGSRYRLDAYIARVSQPAMGANISVSIEVNYTLTDTQTGKVLLQKAIDTDDAKTWGEAFAFLKRVRLATEAAAKKNIARLVQELEAVAPN